MTLTNKKLDTAQQLKFVFIIFIVLSAIEVVNLLTGRILNQFGNAPRTLSSIPGILVGPLLHGSIWHFSSNIVPVCVFSFLLLQYGLKRYVMVTLAIILGSGVLVWLFGRSAYHVGISGVIYYW
jgi:membrane associated rhomboid family serine protease